MTSSHPRLGDTATEAEVLTFIERETEHVELKTGTGTGPLQDTMVAFSNTDGGGTIVIGVTDDRQIVGRRLDQGTEDRIHEAARNAHSLGRFVVREVEVDDKFLVLVEVSQRQEGYAQTSNGRVLVRRGGHNVNLFGDDLWQFMSSRRLQRFERVSTGLGLDAVDHSALAALGRALGWDLASDSLPARLIERGLMTETLELTVAGALVLTDPQQSMALEKAQIEVRRYADDGPDYDRRIAFGGPIPQQVADASAFVADELGTDLIVSGVHRYELPKLPQVVVREAVANAVAHRSYEIDRVNVLIELRPTLIVIRSPGRLPEPVTIDTLRAAQSARNPTIIQALRHLRLAEDAGRGIDVMEDSMAEAMLNPPIFEEVGESVVVTLPLTGPITLRERAWVADLERRGDLGSTDRILIVHAARGETLTNSVARDVLATDALTARKSLSRLTDRGLLVREGSRGGTTYTIADTLAPAARYRLSREEIDELVVSAAVEAGITNSDVRNLTGLDRTESLAVLTRLVKSGRLQMSGARRGARYTATS